MTSPARLPRILLTNDDGINAPGLALLEEIAREFADEVWVVAPEHDQSGTGQMVTLTDPLRVWPRGDRRWAVGGTPADCVAVALSHLMADTKPSVILSGINAGANVGDEVNLSGTLGAAFTGLMLGVPSIGISQACASRKNINWKTASAIVPKMLRHFLAEGWPKDACLSINIPDHPPETITGFSWARQSRKNIVAIQADEREDQREGQYYWLKIIRDTPADASDCAILERGEVSVTALGLDRSIDAGKPAVKFNTNG